MTRKVVAAAQAGGFATVLVINVSGEAATIAIDGQDQQPLAYGAVGKPVRLPAGPHRVGVAGAGTQALLVGDGCQHLWLVKPADAPAGNRLVDVGDCPTPRPAPGRAVVRLVNGTTNASDLSMTVGPYSTAPVAPWTASPWSEVASGPSHFELRRSKLSGIVREIDTPLAPMGAFAAVIAGGGETSVLFFVVDLGRAAAEPPIGIPINTGLARLPGSNANLARLLALVGLALLSSRSRPVALALVIAVAASACGDAQTPRPGSTSIPTSVPSRPAPTPAPSVPQRPKDASRPSPTMPWQLVAGPISAKVVKAIDAKDASRLPSTLMDPDAAFIEGIYPGEPGAALIVAHSVWGAAGVFRPLINLLPDAPVMLKMGEGRSTQWRIEQTFVAPKGSLPSWLWAPSAIPMLVLIGCDPESPPDTITGFHSRNVVAIAAPA